jgi:hypothetical protein
MLRFKFLSTTFLRAPEDGTGAGEPPAPDTSAFTDVLNAGTVIAPPAGDGSDGGEGGEPGTGASAQPGEDAPPPDPPPAPTPPPDGQAKKEGADDPLVALRQQVQDFLAKAPAPQEAPKPTPPAEPAKTPEPAKQPGEAPKYDLEVPDALLRLLRAMTAPRGSLRSRPSSMGSPISWRRTSGRHCRTSSSTWKVRSHKKSSLRWTTRNQLRAHSV